MSKMRNIAKLLVLSAGLFAVVSCGNSGGGGDVVSSILSGSDVVTYTVRFNACGGTSVSTVYVNAGGTIDTAPSTVRDGYEFGGWSTDVSGKSGDPAKVVSFPYQVNANVIFYAVWSKTASGGSHTAEEVANYMRQLDANSQQNHLYIHYYRLKKDGMTDEQWANSYSDWDIWAWGKAPFAGEGARFDWNGRTTSADYLTATGVATVDDYVGATVDIDLAGHYKGGWNNTSKTIGAKDVTFFQKDGVTIDKKIGFQIVKSATRIDPEGEFWTNDGGDQEITLNDPSRVHIVDVAGGGKAYHVFCLQDKVASFQGELYNDYPDPFADDDGGNVTLGRSTYSDVNWNNQYKYGGETKDTAPSFAQGIGVGYQIQVATFADSDGDGFGDIYGIKQKLGYLEKLGVKALWLTPIQSSDSYHGYDIRNYEVVDPKFGSTVSPNAVNGEVNEASAMQDYLDLIEAAHQKGMKVIMDLVLNHTSTSNDLFIKSAQLEDGYRGLYQWGNHNPESRYYSNKVTEANSWFPYGDHEYSYYAKFGSSMPELNYQYQATRDTVVDMTLNWCAKGVDGFRLDAVKHIFMDDEVNRAGGDSIVNDIVRYEKNVTVNGQVIHRAGEVKSNYTSNLSKNLHFYRELNARVKAQYPNAFFVGENFDGNAYNVSPWYSAFDSMFDFYGYFNLTTAAAKIRSNAGSITGGNTFQNLIAGGGQFTLGSGDKGVTDNAGIYNGVKNSYTWDLTSVLNSYNHYRKGSAMPGFFTSNHDIARVINRIASTTSDSNGISEQGTITTQNYSVFRRTSDLVKSAEILMPGLTWIYYGDEIGMTGNFPATDENGQPFTSQSSYADLYWRQPMKWTQGGVEGDGSMTTSLAVTGSGSTIKWDTINASTIVTPANTQMNDDNSEFNQLAKVIRAKHNNPSMITGTIRNNGSTATQWKWTNGGVSVQIDFDNYRVYVNSNLIAQF